MRLAMVKFKIKFVEIWLNFKESQDVSYMLMSNESSLWYIYCVVSVFCCFSMISNSLSWTVFTRAI